MLVYLSVRSRRSTWSVLLVGQKIYLTT